MPAASPSMSQATELAQTVRRRIQAEQMADGQFFMTEAQLAAEYGVSRTVAREAVSRLQALGIVEGRKRKGTAVVEQLAVAGRLSGRFA
jgi:GntR family transcriptional regulator, transcriptional repressor for pyruvate dehydrogenase complex